MARLPADWTPACARRQAGVFTAAQALDDGATPGQVRWRRESGAWRVVAGDGLTLAGTPTSAMADAYAATLTHPGSVLVLHTAARLHGLPVPDDDLVHLHVPRRTRSRTRLVTHRFRLDTAGVVRRGGLLLTDLRRTLHDCIGRLPRDASDGLAAYAIARGLISPDVARLWADPPHQAWGDRRRRRTAEDVATGAASVAERKAHTVLRRADLTGWRANVPVHDRDGIIGVADVLFERERVIVEVDGMSFHGREVFDRDRQRQNRMLLAGYLVLRFTWTDLTTRPDAVVAQIRQALRARRS